MMQRCRPGEEKYSPFPCKGPSIPLFSFVFDTSSLHHLLAADPNAGICQQIQPCLVSAPSRKFILSVICSHSVKFSLHNVASGLNLRERLNHLVPLRGSHTSLPARLTQVNKPTGQPQDNLSGGLL